MATTWLPHPLLNERREIFRKLGAVKRGKERLHLSDFLRPASILFFEEEEEHNVIADALLKTLPSGASGDLASARRAIWQRDGDLPLRISRQVVILRGRVPTRHHLQAALAISPSAETPVIILFVGPVDQNRLHAGMLIAISSIFSQTSLAKRLARMKTPDDVLRAMRKAENPETWAPSCPRFVKAIWDFFRLRYIGIPPPEEVS